MNRESHNRGYRHNQRVASPSSRVPARRSCRYPNAAGYRFPLERTLREARLATGATALAAPRRPTANQDAAAIRSKHQAHNASLRTLESARPRNLLNPQPRRSPRIPPATSGAATPAIAEVSVGPDARRRKRPALVLDIPPSLTTNNRGPTSLPGIPHSPLDTTTPKRFAACSSRIAASVHCSSPAWLCAFSKTLRTNACRSGVSPVAAK